MASDAVFSARYELERHDANAAAMSDIATAWVAAHPSSSAAALRALQHCQDAAAVMATVQRVPACSAVWQAAAELAVVGGVDGGVDARALGRALVQQLVGRARGPVQVWCWCVVLVCGGGVGVGRPHVCLHDAHADPASTRRGFPTRDDVHQCVDT